MAPSTKALKAAFPKLSDEDAKRIRTVIELATDSYFSPTLRPGQAMNRIDSILGTHGVEHIPAGHNSKSPAITYCNTGDTYGTTVMLINGRFRIGCWGDIVERGNYD